MAKWKRKSSDDMELHEVESSYQQYVKGKKMGRESSSKIVTVAFIASAVAVLLIACAALFFYNNWISNTQIKNVSICGISLQGLTTEEATALLSENKDKLLPDEDITVKVHESTLVLTNQDTNAQLDISAIVNAAYIHGRNSADGDALLELDPQDFVKLDASSIRPLLKAFVQPYNGLAVQTKIEVTGERPDLTKAPVSGEPNQILTITLGSPTYLCDPETLFSDIQHAHSKRNYEIVGEVVLIEPDEVTAGGIFNKYCIAPVNATMDPETFIITEGVYGYGFNVAAVQDMLDAAQWGDIITLTLERIKPSITSDNLNAELFKDVLASYTAYASSQEGRDDNLMLACKAINGITLYPGDSFSYNKALGKRTPEKGYKEANTYYGGEIVQSVGGGICQVSSSLYWCAMHADLEITERTNHGRMVTYMPRGMDATVSWGELDFCFRNNSDYPIRIEASSKKGNVTVEIHGTDYKDYYVRIITKTAEVIEYEEVQQEFPADNEFGYVNGQIISTGRTGYVFETYRCKYDKETNREITDARTLEAVSTHKKVDTIIASVPHYNPHTPETTLPEFTDSEESDSTATEETHEI